MDWGTIVGTITGAVVGVGTTMLTDRARWRREQAVRSNTVKRELYASYLAAAARTWNEIHAAVVTSSEPWPERARAAGAAYREGGVFELRYQISITAPPHIVALSDKTMRGYRTLVDKLNAGQVYNSWDELRSDCQEWFDTLRDLRHEMRADLALDTPRAS
ncbi:hypothetical protein [Kitasatospora sp. A2-31]|uniref:hypothetical protein n=1 Tax=Kitasatospora sp. A2-31 TaxID=2916414 RepID=UPI001EECF736|nr:hypothetical protein [Kitasatospora sp. A2-31]MCG6499903.1 hypothetical protein [Kitasatospora sp. A2-31]